jgi:DNA-binding NarL/FixJ family response regulator
LIRILVTINEELLSSAVMSTLSLNNDIEIFTMNGTDKSALVSALEEIQPDAVIINESLLFTHPSTLLGWLKLLPDLNVIVLDEKANLLHIYKQKEVILKQATDLIAVIRKKLYLTG